MIKKGDNKSKAKDVRVSNQREKETSGKNSKGATQNMI
jgi:hypothetical protein